MYKTLRFKRFALFVWLLYSFIGASAQFTTCDTTSINAHLFPAGFQRLYVPTMPCSMYFYNPTPVYGIDAHQAAFNLNVPQFVPDNGFEDTAVANALWTQGVFMTNAQVWLGISDSGTFGNWHTIATGATAPYLLWEPGEPNNLSPPCKIGASCAFCFGIDAYWCAHGEECVVMQANYKMLDNACQGTNKKSIAVLELNTCPVLTRPHDTIICTGNSVNVTTVATRGGTAPYTYSWNPGGIAGAATTLSPGATTTYTVEAVDHYLCKTDSTFTIAISTSTTAMIVAAQSSVCTGVSNTISMSSISATATYTWNFAGGTIMSGSGAGPYSISWGTAGSKTITVTITDNGCSSQTSQTVTVTGANAGPNLTLCIGATDTLGTPAVAGATYSWSPAGGLSSSSIARPTIHIASNNTGAAIDSIYILSVTQGGCVSKDTVHVYIYTEVNNTFANNPTSVCSGENTTINFGGSASAGAVFTWNFDTATIVSGSGAGSYLVHWATPGVKTMSLTIVDSGCTGAPFSKTITVTDKPHAFTGPDHTTCSGDSVHLGAASLSGIIYLWTPYTNITNDAIGNPVFFLQNLGTTPITTTYTLILDGGVCTPDTAHVNITVNPVIPVSIAITGATSFCMGDSVVLSDTVASHVHYLWSNNDTTASITVKTTGNYAISATDTIGCQYVSNLLIAVNVFPLPTVVLAPGGELDESCYHAHNGQLTVQASGGSSPYQYHWNTTPAQNSATAINLAPGAYIVTAVDLQGCTDTGMYQIQPAAYMGIKGDTAIAPSCAVGTDGIVIVAPVGGSAPFTYSWSNGSTGDTLFNGTVGNVTVTLTDNNNCTVDSVINIPLAMYAYIGIHPDTIISPSCATGTDAEIVVSAIGGHAPYTYAWSAVGANGDTLRNVPLGSYTVTMTDSKHCTADTVLNIPLGTAQYLGIQGDSAIAPECATSSDGRIYVSGLGGLPPYSFTWSTGATGVPLANVATGSYTVTMTDSKHCTADTILNVPLATRYVGIQIDSLRNVSCYGYADGAAYLSTIGTKPPISYNWSNGATMAMVANLHIDTLHVSMTDSNGCKADTTLIISQPPPVVITPLGDLSVKYGDETRIDVTVTPLSNYSYHWSPAATLSCADCPSPNAFPNKTTVYMLTVTDINAGCADTAAIRLYVDPAKHIFVPNVFSPNGDGKNDIYQVFTYGGVKYFEMEIFDRWGEKVYQSNDIKSGWDGTYNGVLVNAGLYVYQTTLTFADGETIQNKGTLTVFR